MFQWTTNYLYTSPSGVSGVSVTPSGVAWANSPWAEIHPGTDLDWVLTTVILCNRGAATRFEVDIGVVPVSGAISGCVPVTTLKGFVDALTTYGDGVLPIPIPEDVLPVGRRVGVRMRKSGTGTTAWSWAMQYYKKPLAGNVQTTTKPMKVLPSAADGVNLTAAASGFVFGPWVQLTASAAADMVIAAVGITHAYAAGVDFEVQIGKGGVGVEAALLTVKGYENQAVGIPGYYPIPNPREGISTGDRVVARYRKSGTNTTGPNIHLCYYEKPL